MVFNYSKFFNLDPARQIGTCKTCFKAINFTIKSKTNLQSHLKLNHSSKYDNEIRQTGQRQLQFTNTGISTVVNAPFSKQEKITERIVQDLIGKCGLYFHFIPSEGFKSFINTIEPRFEIPCYRTLNRKLETISSVARKKLVDLLNAVPFSISLDEWRGSDRKSYLAGVVSFINSKTCTFQSKLLFFKEIRDLVENDYLDSIVGKWLGCAAHLLQLVVGDALREVNNDTRFRSALSKCSKIAQLDHQSSLFSEKLIKRLVQTSRERPKSAPVSKTQN